MGGTGYGSGIIFAGNGSFIVPLPSKTGKLCAIARVWTRSMRMTIDPVTVAFDTSAWTGACDVVCLPNCEWN